MTAPDCALCKSPSRFLFAARDLNRRVSRATFDYWRCASCGLIFIGKIPDDLPQYYATGYHTLPRSTKELERIGPRIGYQIELVRQFVPSGRLLEIGAGSGSFAWLARHAGYRVEALEQDAECCDHLERVVGIDVTRTASPSEILSMRKAQYDVVAMWHVIEHLPSFWDVLRSAVHALAPGGVLVIATPNPEAWQFGILGARWPHVDSPRHLYLIPSGLLRRLVEAEGLQCVLLTADDPGGRRWNRFGWGQSAVNLMPGRPTGTVWGKGVAAIVGGIVGTVTTVFERGPLKGSAYTVLFRKDFG